MKKLTFLLAAFIGFCLSVSATETTWVADDYATANNWVSGNTQIGKTDIALNGDLTLNIGEYTTAPKYYTGAIRVYKSSKMTIKGASGVKISKIVFTCESSTYAPEPSAKSSGSVAKSGATLTWTGSTNSLTLTCSTSQQTRIKSMQITYTGGSDTGSTGGNSTGSDKYAPLYLRGDFNGWAATDAWKMTSSDGVTYTIKNVNIPAISEFKIASSDWKTSYGGVSSISLGKYSYLNGESNATLDCNVTNATVTFHTDTKGILVKGTTTSKPASITTPTQGWPASYEGVMLQAFYWDSYSESAWAYLESQAATLSKYFKLMWIPQAGKPSWSPSMGYDPVYWFNNYNSDFGNEAGLRSMIKTYKSKGVGMIADVVINHRGGASNWYDFPAETWNGVTYSLNQAHICSTDEVFHSGPLAGKSPQGNPDTGDDFAAYRDLDHTSPTVQSNCKGYCRFLLEDLGYAGFRYDMVKGYAPQYCGMYNEYANPTYSVGEYWDTNFDNVKNWIEGTGRKSAAFDFPFKYAVNDAFASGDMRKLVWNANGTTPQPCGMIHNGYGQYSVTFVDNHDTARESARFQGNVIAANAFMLMSPGTPCVFLPHWTQYSAEIARLINVRNSVGVNNISPVKVLRSTQSCYMAEVTGSKGKLVVKIGSEMASPSGFSDSDIVASGSDYCVWTKVKISGSNYSVSYPDQLYLIGNVNGNGWVTNSPVAATTAADGVYTWNNVTIDPMTAKAATGAFSLVSKAGSNWDIVNQANRYGAETSDELVTKSARIVIYPGKVSAAGALAWTAAKGNYKVVADLSTMTLTLTPIAEGTSTAVFVAPGSSADGVKLLNADGTGSGSASNNLLNRTFTAKDSKGNSLVTFEFTGGGSSKMASYNTLVRWYKGNVLTLTPAAGKAITKVEVAYTGATYGGPFTASSGSVNASSNPIVWTGNCSSALNLTASGQIRFSAITVTLGEASATPATGGSEEYVYVPVTKKSQLVVGDTYIIASPSAKKAMTKYFSSTNSGYIKSAAVNIESDGAITKLPAGTMEIKLAQGTNSTSYALQFEDEGTDYFIAAPSASTTLSRTTTKSTSNNLTIAVTTSVNTFSYVKNSRRLNYGTANSGCFQSYANSSSSKIRLYRKVKASNRVQAMTSDIQVTFAAPSIDETDVVRLLNSDGTEVAEGRGASNATLYDNPLTANDYDGDPVVTFNVTYAKTNYTGAYGDHIRWYANNVITLTPSEGYAITDVEIGYTEKSYMGSVTTTSGEETVTLATDEEEKMHTWTGNTTEPLNLTAAGQVRMTEMRVFLSPATPEANAEQPGLETYTAALDNLANWAKPHAYLWTEEGDPLVEWPGTAMDFDSDTELWVVSLDSEDVPGYIIFNDGVNNSGNQTEDLEFINGETYANEYDGDLTAIFLVGSFNNWAFQEAYKFQTEDGIVYNYTVDHLAAGSQFKIASRGYNPVDLGGISAVECDTPYILTPNVFDSNCVVASDIDHSLMSVNIDTNTMMLYNTLGVDAIEAATAAPRYYNLTGREVSNPAPGLYIVVRGSTVTKEIIR